MDAKTSGPTFDRKPDIYKGPNYLPTNYLLEKERKNSNYTAEKYGDTTFIKWSITDNETN